MSAQFFTEEDFKGNVGRLYDDKALTLDLTLQQVNGKLNKVGIKGFAQKYRGEWSFTERVMKGDTHNAILLNLDAIEPCIHEKHMVKSSPALGIYRCECGVEVEPAVFVETKK